MLGTSAEGHVAQREKQQKEKEKARARNGAGSTGVPPSSAIMVPVSSFYFIFLWLMMSTQPTWMGILTPSIHWIVFRVIIVPNPHGSSFWPFLTYQHLKWTVLPPTPSPIWNAFYSNTVFHFSSFLRTMSSESPPPPPFLFNVSIVDKCQSLVWDHYLFSL